MSMLCRRGLRYRGGRYKESDVEASVGDLDGPAGLGRLDGRQRHPQRFAAILAGDSRCASLLRAVDEMGELGRVRVAEHRLEPGAGGAAPPGRRVQRGIVLAAVAYRHHAAGPEDLGADVVAEGAVEADVGRPERAVRESDRADRRV